MRIKTIIICVLTACFFGLSPLPSIHAEQDTTSSFSPIIIIDSTKSKGSKNNLMMQHQSTNANDTANFATKNLSQHNKLQAGDLDGYALALGATFHINDFLNVGAACGMPLTNEEPIQVDDLSIEAMVTMQF